MKRPETKHGKSQSRNTMKRREFLDITARTSLTAGVIAAAHPLLANDRRQTISGRVLGDGQPLGNVLVSDGRRVVRTGAQGEYQLDVGPNSGPFVFVSTPRGWWTDAFHVRLDKVAETGRADFALNRTDQPDRFDFVFACDLASPKPWAIPKLKASIEEINQLDPAPGFLLVQGDLWLHGADWLRKHDTYADCAASLEVPVRYGRGNHEYREYFEQVFGPSYYSFDWGEIHFIILDGNRPIPGVGGFYGTVDGAELAWLKADLAAQPQGKTIIVGVHIPIVSTYPERRTDLKREKAPFWQKPNDRLLTDLFAQYGVKLVLQGHMHENERITVGGVEYVESISLSGTWWKNRDVDGLERGVDGCPRGYRIVSVDGNEVTHRYHSSCESHVNRKGEFLGLPNRVSTGEEITFRFNCYDAPNGSTAEARIDGRPWQPMTSVPYKNTSITKPHHYRITIKTDGLPPGQHTVEARTTWPDSTVVVEKNTVEIIP